MKLILGGYAQGKLKFTLEHYGLPEQAVWEATLPQEVSGTVVINKVQDWVRMRLAQGGCPEEEIEDWLSKHPDCILICDEVGNGIVPMEAMERQFRERTGRLMVRLAGQAEEVERVICGIGQKIK